MRLLVPRLFASLLVVVGCKKKPVGGTVDETTEIDFPATDLEGNEVSAGFERTIRRAVEDTGERQPVGGGAIGFVDAFTRSGRLIAIREFASEPEGWGHHGETSVANELAVYDTATGERRVVQEVLFTTPDLTHWLVLADDALWLVGDDGTWESLPGADIEADGNRCLAHRGGAFGPEGDVVSWVTSEGLRVRPVDGGEVSVLPSEGRLWRGFPDGQGGAVLIEVAAEEGWPMQRTSCACRWCNRFAMSYGMYGWSGPEFALFAVDAEGNRAASEGPPEGAEVEPGPCRVEPTRELEDLQQGPWTVVCDGED